PDTTEHTEPAQPVNVHYDSYWRDDYPVLKRGETLTYAGGENIAENTADEGLPALVAFASAQLSYDSVNPPILVNEDTLELYSARVVRPLDRFEESLTRADLPGDLTPANPDRVMADGSRWYFRELPGSLQKRFYYESVETKLVFRGRLNNLELGDPDLTQTPISLSVLESNAMTQAEFVQLKGLGSGEWAAAVRRLYR
ncbi:MAG: hypothetical protein GY953_40075, partial [bacterium]|nr:hypothetical protein [bacterium]